MLVLSRLPLALLFASVGFSAPRAVAAGYAAPRAAAAAQLRGVLGGMDLAAYAGRVTAGVDLHGILSSLRAVELGTPEGMRLAAPLLDRLPAAGAADEASVVSAALAAASALERRAKELAAAAPRAEGGQDLLALDAEMSTLDGLDAYLTPATRAYFSGARAAVAEAALAHKQEAAARAVREGTRDWTGRKDDGTVAGRESRSPSGLSRAPAPDEEPLLPENYRAATVHPKVWGAPHDYMAGPPQPEIVWFRLRPGLDAAQREAVAARLIARAGLRREPHAGAAHHFLALGEDGRSAMRGALALAAEELVVEVVIDEPAIPLLAAAAVQPELPFPPQASSDRRKR